ncbi:MAG: hypothetical protein MUF84_03340 [Anaerolineae bacterium]|jgi:hypothetical protein|nr:hypothetical protein [Anaerolineae bacterium]
MKPKRVARRLDRNYDRGQAFGRKLREILLGRRSGAGSTEEPRRRGCLFKF